MKNVLSIAKREILSFFVSPVAYFVVTGFVLLSGYFFASYLSRFNMIVRYYTSMPFRGQMPAPNLNQYVVEPFYQTLALLLVFLVPVLTMKLIAEEKKAGTFELLATSPLSVTEIVLGKFVGVGTILLIMLGLALIFPLLLCLFGQPGPEVAPIFSGFLGVVLLGLGFASIGMAASALTENQIVAAFTATVTLLLLYVIYTPGGPAGGFSELVLKRISPVQQIQDMVKGVISVESCVYFLSLFGLGVFLSQRALEAQRWR